METLGYSDSDPPKNNVDGALAEKRKSQSANIVDIAVNAPGPICCIR